MPLVVPAVTALEAGQTRKKGSERGQHGKVYLNGKGRRGSIRYIEHNLQYMSQRPWDVFFPPESV